MGRGGAGRGELGLVMRHSVETAYKSRPCQVKGLSLTVLSRVHSVILACQALLGTHPTMAPPRPPPRSPPRARAACARRVSPDVCPRSMTDRRGRGAGGRGGGRGGEDGGGVCSK